MGANWEKVLLAYLHDPPDKALSIRGHVSRARDNAQIVVGDHVSRSVLEDAVQIADPQASIAGAEGERAVGPENASLRIIHPLSAIPRDIQAPELDDELVSREKEQLRSIIANLPGDGTEQARNRFLALWRLWPDALAANANECLTLLPADTRIPDHTIWNHLDVTAAFKAAETVGQGTALLAFALGPVQRFIEASRSVRDLWSGSMILSWLAFRAMLPIIKQLGPTALVYPALRGNPLLDRWLRDGERLGDKVPQPSKDSRLTPSLPHRFLAIMPWGVDGKAAHTLADDCQKAVACAWQEMAIVVRQQIQNQMNSLSPGWDKRWESQIKSYFSASTAVLPLGGLGDLGEEIDKRLAQLLANQGSFGAAFSNAEAVRKLARSIPQTERPGYDQDHVGRWQYQVELVTRSLVAHRSVRHIPTPAKSNTHERYPQKCTLLSSFEQMGPDDLGDSRRFWDSAADSRNGLSIDGVRIRKGEALCAVAMVKRFASPAFLAKELDVGLAELRFPDTWTIAAAEWLAVATEQYGIELGLDHGQAWNGQWLHWSKCDQDLDDADKCPEAVFQKIQEARKPDKCGNAPVYYAILKLDGDGVGAWLRGKESPTVRCVMHPKLVVDYYESLGDAAKAGLDARRPVGPALHAAISTALANFALHVVPAVVSKHHGTVIYSGGDDTLVLLPASQALACALELRATYSRDWHTGNGNKYLMMGSKATLSGGLVVVHAKDDLRLALQDARRAEERAKEQGKDALTIIARRRSGEHTSALCPWDFAPMVENWREQFDADASDRWVYHLCAEQSTLEGLPVEAIKAEMRRQLRRAESPTPERIPPDQLVATFDRFRKLSITRDSGAQTPRFPSLKVALGEFLTLCHTAAFLARGRD